MADEFPPMKNFEADDFMDIEQMAAGMSEKEVLDYYDLTIDDLDETEAVYFRKHFKRGRGAAKRQMVEALMRAAKAKNGGQFAALYLTKQAEDWPIDKNGNVNGKNSFSFTVVANKDNDGSE